MFFNFLISNLVQVKCVTCKYLSLEMGNLLKLYNLISKIITFFKCEFLADSDVKSRWLEEWNRGRIPCSGTVMAEEEDMPFSSGVCLVHPITWYYIKTVLPDVYQRFFCAQSENDMQFDEVRSKWMVLPAVLLQIKHCPGESFDRVESMCLQWKRNTNCIYFWVNVTFLSMMKCSAHVR